MKTYRNFCVLALLLSANTTAFSAVIQTEGAGSAINTNTPATAQFESKDALQDNPYTESGLTFTRTNLSDDNNGCGYAGCKSAPGLSNFSGNYMYGSNHGYKEAGFFTIKSAENKAFTALEFMIGNGQPAKSQTQSVYWSAYLGGNLVGSGNINEILSGKIIGFASTAGFDELQYTDSLQPSKAAPAFDAVRAQMAPVPVPGAVILFGSAMLGWFGIRGRKS